MKRKFTYKLKNTLSSLLVVIIFSVACILCGAIIVLPVWKWAESSPSTYSIAVIAVIALYFIYSISKAIIKHGKKHEK